MRSRTAAAALLASVLAAACYARTPEESLSALKADADTCPVGSTPQRGAMENGAAIEWCEAPDANGYPVPHGPYVEHCKNGRKRLFMQFELGALTGDVHGWRCDGSAEFAGRYSGGLRRGRWTLYNTHGLPWRVASYDDTGRVTVTSFDDEFLRQLRVVEAVTDAGIVAASAVAADRSKRSR